MFKIVVCFGVLLKCLEVLSAVDIANLIWEHENLSQNFVEDDFFKEIFIRGEEIPTSQAGTLHLTRRATNGLLNGEINVEGDRKIIRTLYAILEEAEEKYGNVAMGHMDYFLDQLNLFQFDDHPTSETYPLGNSKLHVDDLVEFVGIINTMLRTRPQTNQILLNFKDFTSYLSSFYDHFWKEHSNLSLVIWRPFVTNITGFGLYKNSNDSLISMSYIYSNETWKDIDTDHLEIAAYVPAEFLESLSEEISEEDQSKLSVVMFIVQNDKYFQKYTKVDPNTDYVIGFAIPQFCKNNKLPMLKAFFRPQTVSDEIAWTDFGSEYDDWLENKCILPTISYFGRFNSGRIKYYQSVTDNYCMPATTSLNKSTINWRIIRINEKNYPDKFCMNADFTIPSLVCNSGAVLRNPSQSDLTCYNHPTSKATEFLYTVLINCLYNLDCNLNNILFIYASDASYVDIKMYFSIRKRIIGNKGKRYDINAMANALNIGLKLVEDKARFSNHQITYMTSLMHGFWECVVFNYHDMITVRQSFIHHTFRPFMGDIVGLVVSGRGFANYEILPLTKKNITKTFETDTKVEVAIYISEFKEIFGHYNYTVTPVDIFVVHNNKLKGSEGYSCNSRIVVVRPVLPDKQSVKFRTYLRNIDGKNHGTGLWATFEAKNEYRMICLSESNDGNYTNNLYTFSWKA